MAYTQQDLALAIKHVREGEARTRALEVCIERLREQGFDVGVPASVLVVFKDVLAEMHRHEIAIRAEIRRRGEAVSRL